jgi:ligand-binding sensor domain-containing protein
MSSIRTRRLMLALALLIMSLGAAGCLSSPSAHSAAPDPTAVMVRRPTRLRATPPPPASSPTPGPTPTLAMAPLTVSDARLLYWSDPNNVSAILYAGDGDAGVLWAATSAGVARWTPEGHARLFTPADGLASPAIAAMGLDGEGRLWVSSADAPGWSLWDGQLWHTYPSREDAVEAHYATLLAAPRYNPALWFRRAESNWLWLATPTGTLRSFDGKRWRQYTAYNGVTPHTWMALVAPDGRVWGVGAGLSTCEEGEVWWSDHALFSEIGSRTHVTDAALDPAGSLWLSYTGASAQGGGAARFDLAEGQWEGYLPSLNPRIPGQVLDIEIEADGSVWLSGEGGLAFYRRGRPWQRITLPGVSVRGYAHQPAAPGAAPRLWLATTEGIYAVNEDGTQLSGPWRLPAPIVGSQVVGLAKDAAGRLLVATRQGLSRLEPDGRSAALLLANLNVLRPDAAGGAWAGATDGLYRITDEGATRVWEGAVLALTFDAAGDPWLANGDGVLFKLVDGAPQRMADLATLLGGALPRDMDLDAGGTLWIASENGMGVLAADGTFRLDTGPDQLLSSDVRAVRVGSEGLVWAATAKGLARHRPDGRWTRFTPASTEGGLPSWEMWGLHAAPDGQLWMATSGGLSHREPENADWAYFELAEARCLLPDGDAIWVGTPSGLYRVQAAALTAVE